MPYVDPVNGNFLSEEVKRNAEQDHADRVSQGNQTGMHEEITHGLGVRQHLMQRHHACEGQPEHHQQ